MPLDFEKVNKLSKLLKEGKYTSKEYKDTYKSIAPKGEIVKQISDDTFESSPLEEVIVRPSNYDKGERFGRKVINSTNETGKQMAPILGGMMVAPFAIGGMASNIPATIGGVIGDAVTQGVVKGTTDYNSWGDMIHDKTGLNPFLAELVNPGAWMGGIATKSVVNTIGRKVANSNLKISNTKNRFGNKPITEAERAGIPKGERKSPSPYKQIGTVTESKSKKETLTVDSPIFGSFIDNGSQQTVFQNTLDPSKVLKVYTERKFTSAPEIKEFHKQWMKRNRLPLQERINFEGYLQGDNRIYPVYSQNKVNVLGNILPKEWTTIHLPKLNAEMHKLGYKGTGTYTNGKLTVGEISPFNVGYINGNLRLIDADIYRKGGKLLLPK